MLRTSGRLCSSVLRSANVTSKMPKSTYSRSFCRSVRVSPSFGSSYISNNVLMVQYDRRSYASVTPFKLADVGEGIAECEIISWSVSEGQEIQQFDMICEVQSDKATAEITSPYDGKVLKLYHNVGDMAKVGSPLVDILTEDDESSTEAPTNDQESVPEPEKAQAKENSENSHYQMIQTKGGPLKVLATPAVRMIARTNNIDLADVPASGKEGRVMKEDILSYIEGGMKAKAEQEESATSQQIASTPEPAVSYQAEDREILVKGIKKVMVKSMTAACQIPHFGYCEEIEMNELKALREQMKPLALERNIKLSYLPFLLKACSLALKEYPDLNAYTNSDCSVVTLKGSHNIGIAMDTPNGLIVPNIKNVQDKSIFDIARDLNALQSLGSAGKLGKEHLEGGTFTLSNVGAIGGTYASPILFLPQVAIGALGKIQTLPRYDTENNVVPMNIMNVSWSADHRVIDGATMARFSNVMKSFIEKPTSMILAMK